MIAHAVLSFLGCTEQQLIDYLDRCDEVFNLPNGYAVRKADVMHMIAPQKALSGRKLIRSCQTVLSKVHEKFPVIYAPVKKIDMKSQLFVKKLGFQESKADDTHIWFSHRSLQCD